MATSLLSPLSSPILPSTVDAHDVGSASGADSSLAAAVAMAPFDSGFDPRQRRHLIRAQLMSQLIRVQLVLLD